MAKSLEIKHIAEELKELDDPAWSSAKPVKVKSYWSGQRAPVKRRFVACLLWSDNALYIKFDANQGEPPVIHNFPKLDQKTPGLWKRDVCEVFLAPDRSNPNQYMEFEVAPSGEWLDLKVSKHGDERIIDDSWESGMRTMTRIGHDLIEMAIRVEWSAFGGAPKPGDTWLGNLLRCVGAGKNRGYLAWSATRTETPDFHVPERFGEFVFLD